MTELNVRPLTLLGVGSIEFADLQKGDFFSFDDDLDKCYFVIGNVAEVVDNTIPARQTEVIKLEKVGDSYFVRESYLEKIETLNVYYEIKMLSLDNVLDYDRARLTIVRKNGV